MNFSLNLVASIVRRICAIGLFISILYNSVTGDLTESDQRISNLEYGSYYKGAVCQPREPIRRPKTQEEVIFIVREAIRRGTTCKAFGGRNSVTDIICTDGIPIDMSDIGGLQLNSDKSVSVGAGVSLRDLGDFLMTHGRALKTIPAFGNITIGGAIGTGAHGSSIKYTSSISEQVIGLVVVNGLGQVWKVSDEMDLRAFRVNLGLLGIVLEVRLRTEPLYKVSAHNYVVSDKFMFNGEVIRMAQDTDQLSLYWFPSAQKVVVANWTIVDVKTPGNAETNDHVPPTTASFNYYSGLVAETAQQYDSLQTLNMAQAYSMPTLYRTMPDILPIYTENGVTVQNPAVGYYHKMFAPICKNEGWIQCPWMHGSKTAQFTDNEISVDLYQLPEVMRRVKAIITEYPAVFPVQGILFRFSAATTTYMSTSQGRTTCHFEFYMITRKNRYQDASIGLAAYQSILQLLAFNFNGRSHWGKTGLFFHSREMLERKLHPSSRRAFLEKMAEFDPHGVFLNAFGRRLKGVDTRINGDPAVKHCALLDNCLCGGDRDCAKGQSCSRLKIYPEFPVCKSPARGIHDNRLEPEPLSWTGMADYVQHVGRLLYAGIWG